MRSPGRPDPSRVVQRQFWRLIATGITSAEAALAVGVSVPVGTRWFRHAGGMPPISLAEPTGRYLSFEEREEIAILHAQDPGVRPIARAIGRDPATISRELRRNVTTDVVLSERPAEAEDRAVPGHWEGDLIIGTGRSAIGTIVERSSRSTLLVHLPRIEGWGEKPYVKNGPSLGGYGAIAMNAALTASMTKLPEQLRKTLTWDRGKELSGHAQFALETGTKVFFADPHSPWQRPTNENTNGLLRQYFPKGTDLSRWSAEDLEAVAYALNNRPRQTLGWKTPAEVFEEQLRSLQQPGVASTS